GTGREQRMTITGGSALPKEDIERMVKDAEAHAEEDRQRREQAEVRNTAESLVYQTEKFLADNADKVPADSKAEVEDAVGALKSALEGNDTEAIKSATDRVAQSSQKLGSAMYANAQGAGDAGAGAGAAGGFGGASAGSANDDVVDAEIVDEDEQK
ncbi:Hsp70 family protein, partial [Motilibacter deserti]